MSTLYLVATPIGNLEDISARALRILGSARLIAAEDTRQTIKLLQHFNIHCPLVSYHDHNKGLRLEKILSELSLGDVALVSDAGTPTINDPGFELVQAAALAGHTVCPIPGPSSPIVALSASGLPSDAFLYLGYLPRKHAERLQAIESVSRMPYTLIFLETPHRLAAALADLHAVLGDRPSAIARELTKLHEEIFRGTLSAAQRHFQEPRGEFTLVIGGWQASEPVAWSDEALDQAIRQRLQAGLPAAQIASELSSAAARPRRAVYDRVSQLRITHPED